jgi:phospholipase C
MSFARNSPMIRRLITAAIATFLILPASVTANSLPPIRTVFVILLENEAWADIEGSTNAPYINNTLLPIASRCEAYSNVPGLHPSLPNYLWLEAGTNFGIFDDNEPVVNHQNTTNHLVTLLNKAGISWRVYQEHVSGTNVPLVTENGISVRHNPFVYFDDISGTNNPNYSFGITHVRPYTELSQDLTNNTVVRYNFIIPDDCNDGHDVCLPLTNSVLQADSWLAAEVPKILSSAAYTNDGALFITWDESYETDSRVGMIVLSPFARGDGYANTIYYTHSSMLRTLQEIFGVGPFLGDAANATNLSDLFIQFGISQVVRMPSGGMHLIAGGVTPGRTNVIEASTNLVSWIAISTNVAASSTFAVIDPDAKDFDRRFYRLLQLP